MAEIFYVDQNKPQNLKSLLDGKFSRKSCLKVCVKIQNRKKKTMVKNVIIQFWPIFALIMNFLKRVNIHF